MSHIQTLWKQKGLRLNVNFKVSLICKGSSCIFVYSEKGCAFIFDYLRAHTHKNHKRKADLSCPEFTISCNKKIIYLIEYLIDLVTSSWRVCVFVCREDVSLCMTGDPCPNDNRSHSPRYKLKCVYRK